MKVLAINCGSTSLEFRVLDAEGGEVRNFADLPRGSINGVGKEAQVLFREGKENHHKETTLLPDFRQATNRMLDWLHRTNLSRNKGWDAVGHRIVHGGSRYTSSALIDEGLIEHVSALRELAPLHNAPVLAIIRAFYQGNTAEKPMVAVFDSAFHRDLPERASLYAIPYRWNSKYRIRRHGFHGLAHRSMLEQYCETTGKPRNKVRLITLQLGGGCSAAAIAGGHSVDTSMGLTPLEGLMMSTRSGDVDPSLPGYLAREEGVDTQKIEHTLNTRSGLRGVSGSSGDMRELLEAALQGDGRAALAIEMFCYRIQKCVGAYLAALSGADAIVFGGGIGENAPAIRENILRHFEWCGLRLDRESNDAAQGRKSRISAPDSVIDCYVLPVDETKLIAQETADLLQGTATIT